MILAMKHSVVNKPALPATQPRAPPATQPQPHPQPSPSPSTRQTKDITQALTLTPKHKKLTLPGGKGGGEKPNKNAIN